MLFTFIAGLVACQSTALRPDAGRARRSHTIAEFGNLVKGISNPEESMPVLRAATGIVEDILAQNATEHLSDDDQALLREAREMIKTSLYASMDSAHRADQFELNEAAKDVAECNADIEARQAPSGDLGKLYAKTRAKQAELDRLQREVDAAIIVNETEWRKFFMYMQQIVEAPDCPVFPPKPRKMPALDVYFKDSAYVDWFTHNQGGYYDARQKYLDADAALQAAIEAFNKQRALRDVQYCDWKAELLEACASFDACYASRSDLYTKIIVPRIRDDMNARIEIYKAGETLIHQVNFLLGEVESQETPPVDTGRYELDYPVLVPKGECDLDILDAAYWVPTPECDVEYEVCPGLHETTCGTNLNWHSSIDLGHATKRCVPGWARTSGGTCKQWCGERGFECLRAQDTHPGRCTIEPRHERQTTEENGCLQKWHDQICECGLTVPLPTRQSLVYGCSAGPGGNGVEGNIYEPWGLPRVEWSDEAAGEAVCCNDDGKATRHLIGDTAVWKSDFSHSDCTSTDRNVIGTSGSPSHTYDEAKALCEQGGARLCRSQEEVDTACHSGCHFDHGIAWIEVQ